ncbi:unnamed protein product [Lathyrus sativus]|nr:unnamed protein product [Lathyrus sativus]
MKRASEWNYSQEIPSDVTVQIGEASYSLHKFPLISKSGYIRKLISECCDANSDILLIELIDIPGGSEAFELAAKFCYGINFEISVENIAMLRCVAEYLEMTEDYSVGNLAGRTDSYLNDVALKSMSGAISILHISETLLPIAEKAKLVSRCIDAIAYIASKESQFCSSGRSDGSSNERVMNSSTVSHQRPVVDWWAEDLTVLRIDFFQRVLIAMMARGFKQCGIGPIIMLYSQKSLRGLEIFGKGRKEIEPHEEHEKRIILETLVSLMPREKNAISVGFLSIWLKAAKFLETTVACRFDLERRIAMQLGQAVLDDLLIPSYSGNTSFDVDTVQRIMMSYLESELENRSGYNDQDEYYSSPQRDVIRVGKLLESYLAEIATDRNLSVPKFICLAELMPEKSRTIEDGMYRAIDIYLKAHPFLSDADRKKVCSMMDCQKLSREARAHAAQNNRLPAQNVAQVLYHDQQRLRDNMDGTGSVGSDSPSTPDKRNVYSSELYPASNEVSKLRRENEELKLEITKLKMKIKEIEKCTIEYGVSTNSPLLNSPSAHKPPLHRKSFLNSVSRKLGRLSPFSRTDPSLTPAKDRIKLDKVRRYSVS